MKRISMKRISYALSAAIRGCISKSAKAAVLFCLMASLVCSLAACQKEENKTIDLNALHTEIKEAYGENYIPAPPMEGTDLNARYGLTEDMYTELIAEFPMISVNVDEFVAVHAAEGKAADVKAALDAYQKMLQDNSMQYPMNVSKIQASQVIAHGDYVFFVMLSTMEDVSGDGEVTAGDAAQAEEEALNKAKEDNQKAVDIISSYFEA